MSVASESDDVARTPRWSWKRRVGIALSILIGLPMLLYIVVGMILYRNFTVPTGAMSNAVLPGDRVLVERTWLPQRGDVVAFLFPGLRDEVKPSREEYYLFRCIAWSGDTVQLHGGRAIINSVAEPARATLNFDTLYAAALPDDRWRTFPDGSDNTRDEWGPMRIPKKGDVIALSDSNVSMWRVFVQREGHALETDGGVITVDGARANAYTVRRDYCFMLGDNRWNALDSRYWGFVPMDDVVGRAVLVYWSKGEDGGPIRWNRIFKSIE